jgi:hypothetical protein
MLGIKLDALGHHASPPDWHGCFYEINGSLFSKIKSIL